MHRSHASFWNQTWLALPLVVAVGILATSPNFRTSPVADGGGSEVRSAPLGADFLQEYVGGYIFASSQRSELYQPPHWKQVQHDPVVVGFEWPASDYFPMVYPPFYYALMSVFSGLSYLAAVRIWIVISGLAISASLWLVHRYYPPGRRYLGLGVVAGMLYVPLLSNFNMGQKGSLLLLILTATWVLLFHRKLFAAGLVFGLIAFKPHLGIVIGLAMLFQRRWQFSLGAVVTVAVLVAGSYAFAPQLWHDYLNVVAGMGSYVQTGGYQLADSHSLWGAMQLLLGAAVPGLVKPVAIAVGLGIVGLLGWGLWPAAELGSDRFARQFAAMVVATIVLSPHFYTYDLTILLLPMLLVVSSAAPGAWQSDRRERALRMVLLALFGLAGMFAKLAGATTIQFSLPLLIAGLVLLSRPRNDRTANRVDVSADSQGATEPTAGEATA